jgi:hypothetical protein
MVAIRPPSRPGHRPGPPSAGYSRTLHVMAKPCAMLWNSLAFIAFFSVLVKSDILDSVGTIASIEEFEEKVVCILPLEGFNM